MAIPNAEPVDVTLEGINIVDCFKKAFCFNVLVCGRTGVGKSSLINNLVGSELCKVNDPGLAGGNLDRGTVEVSATKVNIDNVYVTIFDSPGLQDGTDDEKKYLQEMHEKCKDVNLVLYCMEMISPRYTPAEINATKLITSKFGPDFWKRCVLVMTKANMVRVPPGQKGKERDYHKRLYDNFMEKFRDQLVKQGVDAGIAYKIPGVTTGYVDPNDENERYIWYPSHKAEMSDRPVDFQNELWVTCFERTATESQAKFLRATTKLRAQPLPAASEAEKALMKQLEASRKHEEELSKKYETMLWQQEERFKKQIDQLREEYKPEIWSTQNVPEPDRGPGLGTVALAGAGALMGGPIGAAIGAFVGKIFGW